MSRFAKLQGGPTRIWAPPESPLQIEYSPSLLREVRIANTGVDAFGTLFGARHGKTISVVSTRRRSGLDPVGVFTSRARGQVFLTEEDLERFEHADAAVALVLSGEKAGFFVRDAAGSIETVRSYQEFSIQSQPVKVVKRRLSWVWSAALIPLVLFFVPRRPPPPLALDLREDSGQLRISWNVPTEATLTVFDGYAQTSVAIHKGERKLTYARRTGDVTVRIGATQVRFVGSARPPTETEQIRNSIEMLRLRAAALRDAQLEGQSRIAALERRLQ